MTTDALSAELAVLEEQNRACQACPLRVGCVQVVVSDAPRPSELVVIGEAPGSEEDRVGRPFVGPAGQLLDRILASVELPREEVYLTNIVKCRPPNNRDAQPAEIEICRDLWLRRQLQLLRPRLILTLGNIATQHLLQTREGISRLRGHWYEYQFETGERAWVRPLLHPAYLLRQDSRVAGGPKSLTWHDMQEVRAVWRGEKVPSPHGAPPLQPGLF